MENSREIIRDVLSLEYTFAVVLKETQEPVGSIGIMVGEDSNLTDSDLEGEIGYFDGNEKSRRVQVKCGFRYHHTNREIRWEWMDDIRTEHVTCLTREEWQKNLV